MPDSIGVPAGTLAMLVLQVLRHGPLHGYVIAQRIHSLSKEVLQVEEGSLYPALQKMLMKGWVTAEWGISETNRKVRFYTLTSDGRKKLSEETSEYERAEAQHSETDDTWSISYDQKPGEGMGESAKHFSVTVDGKSKKASIVPGN